MYRICLPVDANLKLKLFHTDTQLCVFLQTLSPTALLVDGQLLESTLFLVQERKPAIWKQNAWVKKVKEVLLHLCKYVYICLMGGGVDLGGLILYKKLVPSINLAFGYERKDRRLKHSNTCCSLIKTD